MSESYWKQAPSVKRLSPAVLALVNWILVIQMLAYVIIRSEASENRNETCLPHTFDIVWLARWLACERLEFAQ